MSKIKYFLQFKNFNNDNIRVEIYKDTPDEVEALELLADTNAVTIDYNSEDDIFKPLKLSGCTVNILTKYLLADLYSGKLNEISAKVFRDGKLFWYGFITPNIYSSDYVEEYNSLSLEFRDTISALEYYDYKYISNESRITSFYDIIISILNRIDPENIIDEIYVHDCIRVNDSDDILNQLLINERNFFDEEEEPQSCQDVIEDIAMFLSMSLIQFENKFIFIDYESLGENNNTFIKYSRMNNQIEKIMLPTNLIDVNKNIYEANANVSLGDIYNKIIVIANNNPIEAILPELFDNVDLVNQNNDPNRYYEKTIERFIYLIAYFKSDKNWITDDLFISGYDPDSNLIVNIPVFEITIDNIDLINGGAIFQKNDSYRILDDDDNPIENAIPSSLNWNSFLSFINYGTLALNIGNELAIKGGYIIIDLEYKLSTNRMADDSLKSSYNEATYYDGEYSTGFEHTKFKCLLKIGEYYYTGNEWDLYSNYLNNQSFYNRVTGEGTVEGQYQYWWYEEETKHFISKEEYDKIKLKDKFWLVHKNKKDDKIKDEWKSLTNQVSYKYNLADSEDGALIMLPEFLIYGKVEFVLFSPENLGLPQSGRTDKVPEYSTVNHAHIKGLTLKYRNSEFIKDIFNQTEYDPDIKYENEIDMDYVNDLDDIELKVNTFSENTGSHSFVLVKKNDKFDYLKDVYNKTSKTSKTQEEHILSKYYNRFSTPKFRYQNSLIDNGITPLDQLLENTLNKKFNINALTYNMESCSVDVDGNEV